MSIRIRVVDGVTVALCAARSVPMAGDVYLDDAQHHALGLKFAADFASEGRMVRADHMREMRQTFQTFREALAVVLDRKPDPDEHAALRALEESNNANRAWWDRTYGPVDYFRGYLDT